MELNRNNIKLFSNRELVKFIGKIGHYEVAKILTKQNYINGQLFLELRESDTQEWQLTDNQKDLLWKCMHQIKSNPLINIDNDNRALQKLVCAKQNYFAEDRLEEDKSFEVNDIKRHDTELDRTYDCGDITDAMARKPAPVPRKKNKYFKFLRLDGHKPDVSTICERVNPIEGHSPRQKEFPNIKRHSSIQSADSHRTYFYSCASVNQETLCDSQEGFYAESDYIYGPAAEGKRNNTIVDRIKKYCRITRKELSMEQLYVLKHRNDYLALQEVNLAKVQNMSNRHYTSQHIIDTNVYETPDSISSKKKIKAKTKVPKIGCFIHLNCVSCYLGC